MDRNKHKKHVSLEAPLMGNFGRNEWAILGTTCDNIRLLAQHLSSALSPQWELSYVDADHKSSESENGGLTGQFSSEYSDKISFQRFDKTGSQNEYQFRMFFNSSDLILVNGNHFQARRQVVVIDPKKSDSMNRKLDRLTSVGLVLLTDGVGSIPANIMDKVGKAPVIKWAELEKIVAFFEKQLVESIPPLNGMVLAGGKSQRMRYDKGQLNYHGKPQREHMGDVITAFCQNTFLSCRFDQVDALTAEYPPLFDTFFDLGPMGALLSAFRTDPNSAWLAVACDLPFLDEKAIKYLVENRNPSAIATSFRSPVNEFPEPLVAIWEPKAYPVLLQFLAQGYSCPRKCLINSKVHLLDAPDELVLRNVNTPDEFDEAIKLITE